MMIRAAESRFKRGTLYADARTARLCALLANINRNPEKKRQPYTPADFMPSYEAEPEEKEDPDRPMTDEEIFEMATLIDSHMKGIQPHG